MNFTGRAQLELLRLLAAEQAVRSEVAAAGRTSGRGSWRPVAVFRPVPVQSASVIRVCLTATRRRAVAR